MWTLRQGGRIATIASSGSLGFRCATAWHERNRLSSRRCRALLGIIDRDPTDPALADLGKYGMGTERSFGDWQEYSGFNYKAGTLDADWGEWEDRAGIVSHGATVRQADGATNGSLHRGRRRLRAGGQGPTCGRLDGSLRRGFRSPEDWSEMQVHVRRSPGGGRRMWE